MYNLPKVYRTSNSTIQSVIVHINQISYVYVSTIFIVCLVFLYFLSISVFARVYLSSVFYPLDLWRIFFVTPHCVNLTSNCAVMPQCAEIKCMSLSPHKQSFLLEVHVSFYAGAAHPPNPLCT